MVRAVVIEKNEAGQAGQPMQDQIIQAYNHNHTVAAVRTSLCLLPRKEIELQKLQMNILLFLPPPFGFN
jgi:hypothetical protein